MYGFQLNSQVIYSLLIFRKQSKLEKKSIFTLRNIKKPLMLNKQNVTFDETSTWIVQVVRLKRLYRQSFVLLGLGKQQILEVKFFFYLKFFSLFFFKRGENVHRLFVWLRGSRAQKAISSIPLRNSYKEFSESLLPTGQNLDLIKFVRLIVGAGQ